MSAINRNSMWIGLAVIVIVLVIGAVAYMAMNDDETPAVNDTADSSATNTTKPVSGADDDEAVGVTIVFTDDGFANSTYAVEPGAKVLVRNDSSQPLQFSSDSHPTHRDEPHLNTPAIGPGQTTTFTAPSEPGEYGFHDHIDASYTGVLVVEPGR